MYIGLGCVLVCEEFPRECFAVFCLELEGVVCCLCKCLGKNVNACKVYACVLECICNDVWYKIACGILCKKVCENVFRFFVSEALGDNFCNMGVKEGCFLVVDCLDFLFKYVCFSCIRISCANPFSITFSNKCVHEEEKDEEVYYCLAGGLFVCSKLSV